MEHISQVIAREVKAGNIRFNPLATTSDRYTPTTILAIWDVTTRFTTIPRDVLDAIPGLKRVEMKRPGPLVLLRWRRADAVLRAERGAADGRSGSGWPRKPGANVIVTACPFCMVNIEDAIKVAGMEGKMTAIDLTELVDQHMVDEWLRSSWKLQLGR